MATRPLTASLALFLALPLGAQGARAVPQAPGVAEAFQAWRAQHPGEWLLRVNPETGTARFLYGGHVEPPFAAPEATPPVAPWVAPLVAVTDADYAALARAALHAAAGMFGIEDATLRLRQVHRLPLSRIGGTDKIAVEFAQEVNGVPVVRGSASVLFAPGGALLAVDTTGLPAVAGLDTRPAVDPRDAILAAETAYARIEARTAREVGTPELVIYPWTAGKRVQPRLAWSIELRTPDAGGVPAGRRMYVAADGAAEVLGDDPLVHRCGGATREVASSGSSGDASSGSSGDALFGPNDLSGHVDAWATPGLRPDTAKNAESLQPMRFLHVSSSAGSADTDAAGNFVIPYGGTAPVDLQFHFAGPWAEVHHATGADYGLAQPFLPGVFQSVAMNPARSEEVTAQANVFACVQVFHDWLKSVDPGEDSMDFPVLAYANLAQTCNAYFNGSSINFFVAGGGCVNSAYSTVCAHEEGHWANEQEGSGNGIDGFGEGNADTYAMYIWDTPDVADNFYGSGGCPGTCFRTGNNTRQFCGDGNPLCYRNQHLAGEVLMGALWKVRRNLNRTLGDAAGDDVANALFLAWMNAYNDGQIRSIIEDHWLSLDDDDGDIGNGTPDYDEIDHAFREQGFPGVYVHRVKILHVPLPDTSDELGPYVVRARVISTTGARITGAQVHYRVSNGGFMTVDMVPGAGDIWTGSIPGQASPAVVDYFVSASDSNGIHQRLPVEREFRFLVGVPTRLYRNDFEGAGDEGWTHGLFNGQDDWQRAAPADRSGTSFGVEWRDPPTAASGSRCWGNDLTADGHYSANVTNHLDSPVIDCSGKSFVSLRFQRWLGVEESPVDEARIYVRRNGVWHRVYTSPEWDLSDSAWSQQTLDISENADGNPTMQIRFELRSDSNLELGGWSLDDVEVLYVAPAGAADTILLSGNSTGTVGGTVSYGLSNAPPAAPWWLYVSSNRNGSTIHGHSFEIGLPYFTAASGTTSAAGTAAWSSGPIPPAAAGRTLYLEARADQAASTFDSNLLSLQVQ